MTSETNCRPLFSEHTVVISVLCNNIKVKRVFDFKRLFLLKTSFLLSVLLQLSPFLEDESLDDHHQLHPRLLVVQLAALLDEAGNVSLGCARSRRGRQRASP